MVKYFSDFKIGIKWTSLTTILSVVILIATQIILARVLVPEDFGILAESLIVINFATAIIPLGVVEAIIQDHEELDETKLSSLFWLVLASSILFFILVFFGAFLVEQFFKAPNLKYWIRLLSISLLLTPFGAISLSILTKKLRFKSINTINIFALFVSSVVSILGAYIYKNVFALIVGYMCYVIIINCFYFLANPIKIYFPRIREIVRTRELIEFGFLSTLSNLLSNGSKELEKVFIGFFLGSHILGLYIMAQNICFLPLRKINPILHNVLFPIYSKLTSLKYERTKYFELSILIILLINILPLAILAIHSNELVDLILGEKWKEIICLVEILCFVGIVRSTSNPGGTLMVAMGKIKEYLYWSLFRFGWIIGGILLILFYIPNIENIAWFHLVFSLVFGTIYHIIIHKTCDVGYKKILIYILKFILILLIVVSISYLLDFSITFTIVIQSLTYLLAVYVLFRAEIKKTIRYIKSNPFFE